MMYLFAFSKQNMIIWLVVQDFGTVLSSFFYWIFDNQISIFSSNYISRKNGFLQPILRGIFTYLDTCAGALCTHGLMNVITAFM